MPVPSASTGLLLLNPLRSGVRFLPSGLSIATLPGSIWGDFGASCPANNTAVLPTPSPSTPFTASCTVSGSFASYGEQAGLVLWSSQRSWVKLVLECLKTGATNVVFASSSTESGPSVASKQPIPFAGAGEPVKALLEVTVSGGKVKARAVVAAEAAETATQTWEVELDELALPTSDAEPAAVASAPAAAVVPAEAGEAACEISTSPFASAAGSFHVGVMAHGAPEGAGRSALFTDISCSGCDSA